MLERARRHAAELCKRADVHRLKIHKILPFSLDLYVTYRFMIAKKRISAKEGNGYGFDKGKRDENNAPLHAADFAHECHQSGV